MGTHDIILGLVSIVVGMLGYFFTRLVSDLRDLEEKMNTCQADMPTKYVMKADYRHDIDEIKTMLSEIFTFMREHNK